MGLFWRRKSKDQFVTLGLNEPQAKPTEPNPPSLEPPQAPLLIPDESPEIKTPHELEHVPDLEPLPAGAGPTPLPLEPTDVIRPTPPKPLPSAPPRRASFSTSILGLDLSVEELQAREAALEQEFSARFCRAVAATRESLSERLDTVFIGRKQIDEELLEQLEEALIAADIGVA